MTLNPILVVKRSPYAFVGGICIGLTAVVMAAPIWAGWVVAHNWAVPVVKKWRVETAVISGADVIFTGTLIKQRDCLFIPPVLARDQEGNPYAIVSNSPTAGKSWGVSDTPQNWGPWKVSGGAGKRLDFIATYICSRTMPIMLDLGTYQP